MNTRKWHSGPPPHIGWWNASRLELINIWRWWDGREWSTCVGERSPISAVVRSAGSKERLPLSEFSWSDYWPENARVPRIDPRKAK